MHDLNTDGTLHKLPFRALKVEISFRPLREHAERSVFAFLAAGKKKYLNEKESEQNDPAIVAGLKAAHMDDVRVTHRAVNIRVLLMCEYLRSTEEVIEMGASTKMLLFIEYV